MVEYIFDFDGKMYSVKNNQEDYYDKKLVLSDFEGKMSNQEDHRDKKNAYRMELTRTILNKRKKYKKNMDTMIPELSMIPEETFKRKSLIFQLRTTWNKIKNYIQN